MGIRVSTNIPEVLLNINSMRNELDKEIEQKLCEAGDEIIEIAKSSHSYKNRTGNLEASTGYGVLVKGKIVSIRGFEMGLSGGDVGVKKIELLSKEISPSESAIIVVAGMEYATYVERCGYVILDDAMFKGEDILGGLLKSIKL